MGGSTLDGTIARLLIDRGPLSVTELVDAVRESGLDLGTDGAEELRSALYDSMGDEFTPLADDRWAYVPALVNDRVVTHRLTHSEIAHDVLTITPDLALSFALPEDSDQLRLVDGVR